jgi:hypothetical protein
VVPNGSVGQKQYLQFAGGAVQAFEKNSTDNGTTGKILSNSQGGTAVAQKAIYPWDDFADGVTECNQLTVDGNVSYDHISGNNWIIAGTSNTNQNPSGPAKSMCIAVSTTDDLDTCSGGTGGCYWNAYTYDLTSMRPSDSTGGTQVYDLADYPRFGTWHDGYYMAFDFIDFDFDNGNNPNYGRIDGTAVCKLDRTDILLGNSSASSATCYSHITTALPPMIHTILPADAETSAYASGTEGEFFLSTINPGSDGSPCVPNPGSGVYCYETQLAYWTWSSIVSKAGAQRVSVNQFIPGCYYTADPSGTHYATWTKCIPQPGTTNMVDSIGDRLMSPLAYMYFAPCEEHATLAASCEYLAVTQTVQESTASPYYGNPTGIRYYTFVAPIGSSTTLNPPLLSGDFSDSAGSLYYWMSSNAIDSNENVGYTFSVGNGSTGNNPSLYMNTIDFAGGQGTLKSPKIGNGSDETDNHWGEYFSISIDPADDLTFWGTGQYFATNQTGVCDNSHPTNCIWDTQIYTCKKGNSSGWCP